MSYTKGLVSVVIPCYNQGKYLYHVTDSVLNQTYDKVEIIVVNDGSTEEYTIKVLKAFERPNTRVLNTKNQGLSMARNNGIAAAKGEFILPLDCDDAIVPDYLEKLLPYFDKEPNIAGVYTNIQVFGDRDETIKLKQVNLQSELVQNSISVCALIRHTVYDQVKRINNHGYNPNMKFGYEDWDFWLSILSLGKELKYIDYNGFLYRKSGTSMIDAAQQKHQLLIEALISNHPEEYKNNVKLVISSLQGQLKAQQMELIHITDQLKKEQQTTRSIIWLIKRIVLLLLRRI